MYQTSLAHLEQWEVEFWSCVTCQTGIDFMNCNELGKLVQQSVTAHEGVIPSPPLCSQLRGNRIEHSSSRLLETRQGAALSLSTGGMSGQALWPRKEGQSAASQFIGCHRCPQRMQAFYTLFARTPTEISRDTLNLRINELIGRACGR